MSGCTVVNASVAKRYNICVIDDHRSEHDRGHHHHDHADHIHHHALSDDHNDRHYSFRMINIIEVSINLRFVMNLSVNNISDRDIVTTSHALYTPQSCQNRKKHIKTAKVAFGGEFFHGSPITNDVFANMKLPDQNGSLIATQ